MKRKEPLLPATLLALALLAAAGSVAWSAERQGPGAQATPASPDGVRGDLQRARLAERLVGAERTALLLERLHAAQADWHDGGER
jgi:hypothetical protein